MEQTIRKHALKNAFDYGKADARGIVGKVIAESPEAKKDMRSTMQLIEKTASEVNALSRDEIQKELGQYEFAEKKQGGPRFWLRGAEKGKVVTRFLPEPNGHPHIGHAKAAFLSSEFAREYEGECLLRFDDTNPESEKQEYVDAIREGLQWLGISFKQENYASDKMPQLYTYAEQMLRDSKAYACTCPQEEMGANRMARKGCACRKRSSTENLRLWEQMKTGNAEKGSTIIRLSSDMASDNTVMRDPTLFRVLKEPHYRQGTKYSAWPTYDFEASISDSLDGITHALRSKEYELRDELYYAILDAVGLRKPLVHDFSRLKIKGSALSKRIIRPLAETGKVSGWDDPRLPTLEGLRRRGILPGAIKEFALMSGLGKQENAYSMGQLLKINRQHLDGKAGHYFFVANPIMLEVANHDEKKTIQVPSNPGKQGAPIRTLLLGSGYYLQNSDADALAIGETFRLKDNFNVRVLEKTTKSIVGEFAGTEMLPHSKKIQWVSAQPGEFLECTVLKYGDLLDGKGDFDPNSEEKIAGYCEKSCLGVAEGEIVQFERFGFCRLDRKENERLMFIYSA